MAGASGGATVRAMTTRTLLATTAAVLAAVPATASAAGPTVAYIDGHDLWYASADGTQKRQITTGGTEERPFQVPSQGPDGTTVVVHRETFDGGSRPVLYRYGGDGARQAANVMPVYSGATAAVYPIGLDMDWKSNAVAYGYSYCGFACQARYQGYWLTFSDNQGAFPTNPQGKGDANFPSFYGTRVISSDGAGSLFIQPDVAEAPFTIGSQGWISGPDNNVYWRRAEVAATGRQVALEWYSRAAGDDASGVAVGEHGGTLPGNVDRVCGLPTAASPTNVTFSYDGTLIAWQDAEGVKVAGAPNLAAGTQTCTLSSPPRVISATGRAPHLGGADPVVWNAAMGAPGTVAPGASGAPGGTPGTAPGPGSKAPGGGADAGSADAPAIGHRGPSRTTRAALRRGLVLTAAVPAAGRVDATATVPASVARRLRLRGTQLRVLTTSAAKRPGGTVVARGRATAKAAGSVRLTLRLTSAARRRLARMRGVTLEVRVSQGAATATRRVKVR